MQLGIMFSRHLAIVSGIGLPVLEVIRRWRTLPGPIATWHHWLDDFFLGALLLGAAWLSRPRSAPHHSRVQSCAWLIAAWGFVCGTGFGSLLAQINHVLNPELGDDPSGIAHGWIVLAKSILLAIGLLGLGTSMRDSPLKSRQTLSRDPTE